MENIKEKLIKEAVDALENHLHIADTGFAEAVEGSYRTYINSVKTCLENGITYAELHEHGFEVTHI